MYFNVKSAGVPGARERSLESLLIGVFRAHITAGDSPVSAHDAVVFRCNMVTVVIGH
ncbi:hypothetical protein [Glycomyces tenuis]|uniref:hypothetical protein n=1 Tax=Glycomyces tenuis TaxID=58116 RepID=UPI0012DD8524|nr:hypothetical protein [Glycomyces tenuis]